jgi:hypothetical protein
VFLQNQCEDYSCTFLSAGDDPRLPVLGGLHKSSKFAKKIIKFFKERIDDQYPLLTEHVDLMLSQHLAHEAFLDRLSMTVLGRDKILDDIQTYVNDARCKTPLVILGSTGAGKSAVMARSVAITLKNESLNAISRNGKTSWILFYHFVGAVPGSNDLGHVLQRLLKKLGLLKDNIPPVMDCLILEVHRVLSSPLTTPCILFFDGLDELNNEKVTDRLLWLPEELPPNIRCILSLTNQTQCHKSLTDRKRPPRELFCGPLSIRARNAIVTEMFANYKERLNDEQLLRLLSKDSSGNPLWLVTACQELRAHRDFKTLQGKIKELSNDLPMSGGSVLN